VRPKRRDEAERDVDKGKTGKGKLGREKWESELEMGAEKLL
jgi:hypothetical protein